MMVQVLEDWGQFFFLFSQTKKVNHEWDVMMMMMMMMRDTTFTFQNWYIYMQFDKVFLTVKNTFFLEHERYAIMMIDKVYIIRMHYYFYIKNVHVERKTK
jgi:hypothetical protein